MQMGKILLISIGAVLLLGCSTMTRLDLPENTQLRFKGREKLYNPGDTVKCYPFSWNAMSGAKYILLRDGQIVEKNRLPVHFRVISFFWPPEGQLYWPFGFKEKYYDLRNGAYAVKNKRPKQKEQPCRIN